MPQVLVLQEAAELAPNENEAAPEPFEAKVDIFFDIFWLPQAGHLTPSAALVLRTSSSNGLLQSLHTNSNNGMYISSGVGMIKLHQFIRCKISREVTNWLIPAQISRNTHQLDLDISGSRRRLLALRVLFNVHNRRYQES